MKVLHSILLLPFFLYPRSTHAQFPSFPDSNALWLMDIYGPSGFVQQIAYHLRATNHDTLINGTWYNSLWPGLEGQGGALAGGLRTDGQERVYYYHPNSDEEFLLYDFDPFIGEILDVWVGDPQQPTATTTVMHIISLEQIENDQGQLYSLVGVLNDEHFNQGGTEAAEYWLQGVGGSGGLLSTFGYYFYPKNWAHLTCMQHNDTIWPAGVPGLCSPMKVPENGSNGIVLFPNPTTGRFTCTFPEPHTAARTYCVYDALGQLLDQQLLAPGQNTTEVDLSGFGAGSYLIKVSSPTQVWHAKVMLE